MFARSRAAMAVAFLSAAVLTAGAVAPAYAHSAAFCRDYARRAANDDANSSALLILPLAAVGAGVGAIAGLAISGLAVSTGAIAGGAGGAVVGGVGTGAHWHRTYNEAYADCRAGR